MLCCVILAYLGICIWNVAAYYFAEGMEYTSKASHLLPRSCICMVIVYRNRTNVHFALNKPRARCKNCTCIEVFYASTMPCMVKMDHEYLPDLFSGFVNEFWVLFGFSRFSVVLTGARSTSQEPFSACVWPIQYLSPPFSPIIHFMLWVLQCLAH